MAIYNTDTKPPKKRKTAEEMIEEGQNDPLVQENERESASEFRKKLFGSAAGIAAVVTAGKAGRPSYDRYKRNKAEFDAVTNSEKKLRRLMDESAKNTADMKRKQAQISASKPESSTASTPEEKPSAGSIIKSRMASKANAENFAEKERLRLGAIERQRGAMQRAEDTAAFKRYRLQQVEQAKSDTRSAARDAAEQASAEEAANLRNDLARREVTSRVTEKAKDRSRERLRGLREERNAQLQAAERERGLNPNIASNPSSGRALRRDLRKQERQGKAADDAAEQAARDKAANQQAEKDKQAELKSTLLKKKEKRESIEALGEQIRNPDANMRAQIEARRRAELENDQAAADEINKQIRQNRVKRRLQESQQGRRSIEALGEQIKNPDANMQGQIKAVRDADIKARMQRLREHQAELSGKKPKPPEVPVVKESSAEAPKPRTPQEENLIKARIARQASREATVKKSVAGKAPTAKKPPTKKMNCGGSVKGSKVYAFGGSVKKLKEPNRKIPKAKTSSAGESAAYVKKELAFMQKKGAPKSMIGHEKREMNAGGMRKMAKGGGVEKKGYGPVKKFCRGGGIEIKGKTQGRFV